MDATMTKGNLKRPRGPIGCSYCYSSLAVRALQVGTPWQPVEKAQAQTHTHKPSKDAIRALHIMLQDLSLWVARL